MPELPEVKPDYPKVDVDEKTLGQNILYAPQEVTSPPAAPNWGTGTSGAYLLASNTTELTAIYTTLNDIYNALLKEGLIKKK